MRLGYASGFSADTPKRTRPVNVTGRIQLTCHLVARPNLILSSPANLVAPSQNTVTGVAHGADKRLVLEPVLGVAVCRMSTVATCTTCGVGIYSLPLRQETVKVIGSRSLTRYLFMALEAVFVSYRYSQFCRLDGGMGIQGKCVVSAQQFGLQTPGQSGTGVTVNTASAFRRVE